MAKRTTIETRVVGDIVEKKCRGCNQFKPFHDYHQDIQGYLGVSNRCKECKKSYYQENRELILARQGEYQKRNMEYIVQRNREWKYKTKFGLTTEEFNELAKNGCMICGTYEDLCIDHNHTTNEVRGVLCKPCNGALGIFRDSIDLLLKAASYLESRQGCSIPEIRSSAKSE